jgi:hypothetical protein
MSSTGTQALGATTVIFRWVEESKVQQLMHASDGFQQMLALTVAGTGASVTAVVTLAAGAQHPLALYVLLSGLGAATVLAGGFTWRGFLRCRRLRSQLTVGAVTVPVPVLLVTPGRRRSPRAGGGLPTPLRVDLDHAGAAVDGDGLHVMQACGGVAGGDHGGDAVLAGDQ